MKKVYLKGDFIEVSDDVYDYLQKSERKMRYLTHDLKVERRVRDKKTGELITIKSREDSIERLMEENFKDFQDETNCEEIAIKNDFLEKMHRCIEYLDKTEKDLIKAIYFEFMTEKDYATKLGISKQAVNQKLKRILEKLRWFMDN